MVNSRCKKEDFKAIEQTKPWAWRLRFSAVPEYDIVRDKEGNPTGKKKESGYLIYTMETVYDELTVDAVRKVRLKELEYFDNSSEVNSFFFNGKQMWYDKLQRTYIVRSIEAERDSGEEYTTLYDKDNVPHTLPVKVAMEIFNKIEVYAKQCYNVTAQHKADLMALDNIDALLAYDVKAGYPEKLEFGDSVSEAELSE